ncbi:MULTISPECIES: hypothetical protein [unclassified Nocardioides]|uniref:hypothetical protein n=1 Tax=unclassified Nocardioides TaxID=2615069 RepID=UPI0007030B25|nr:MULTISPECIES: hypothetical protein [unclassified Nocardioides]KRC49000.1 hypothetical protein ASE19_19085 [Nocardioides sp. Root79]KRC75401.1 hypothetical protein ASE20_20990 [Nocardioides sp. Root240]
MHLRSLIRLAVVAISLSIAGLAALPQAPSKAATSTATVVVPDGPVAARGICGNWKGAVAGYTGWATSKSECNVFGSSSTPAKPYQWGYTWQIPPYSNGRICVQGLGYKWSATKKKTVSTWVSLGCGTSGGGKVPWYGPKRTLNGKTYYLGVAATPKVRAKVQLGFLGGAYSWKG